MIDDNQKLFLLHEISNLCILSTLSPCQGFCGIDILSNQCAVAATIVRLLLYFSLILICVCRAVNKQFLFRYIAEIKAFHHTRMPKFITAATLFSNNPSTITRFVSLQKSFSSFKKFCCPSIFSQRLDIAYPKKFFAVI